MAGPPMTPEAAFDFGLRALDAQDEASAIAVIGDVLALHPSQPQLWQLLGLLHRARDDLAPAVVAFDRAAALSPGDARIAHGRARAYLEAGLPATALFDRALALAPQDPGVIEGRASAELAEGHPEAAIAELANALERNPGWSGGYAALARLRWMMGEDGDPAAAFEQPLRTRPKDVQLWREAIGALMHASRYREALAMIDRGRAAAGPHPLFDAHQAACADEAGDQDAASRLFAALGAIADPTIAVYHVRHLLRAGRVRQAGQLAEAWAQGPAANAFWPYLSIIWRLTGDPRWHWLEGDPTLVGVYDIADGIGSLDRLGQLLRSLHVLRHQPLEQSVRGGTQTDGHLFARIEPEIRALRTAVVAAVQQHLAGLPPRDVRHPTLAPRRGVPLHFSGSWSVLLKGGGHHANHVHPGGWFSSALYIALPDEAQRGAAPAGWLSLGQPQAELDLDLPAVRHVEPKPGRLVLFPSTMWHGTVPFDSGERLTVAFDVAVPAALS